MGFDHDGNIEGGRDDFCPSSVYPGFLLYRMDDKVDVVDF
jgi:hypothetical protein